MSTGAKGKKERVVAGIEFDNDLWHIVLLEYKGKPGEMTIKKPIGITCPAVNAAGYIPEDAKKIVVVQGKVTTSIPFPIPPVEEERIPQVVEHEVSQMVGRKEGGLGLPEDFLKGVWSFEVIDDSKIYRTQASNAKAAGKKEEWWLHIGGTERDCIRRLMDTCTKYKISPDRFIDVGYMMTEECTRYNSFIARVNRGFVLGLVAEERPRHYRYIESLDISGDSQWKDLADAIKKMIDQVNAEDGGNFRRGGEHKYQYHIESMMSVGLASDEIANLNRMLRNNALDGICMESELNFGRNMGGIFAVPYLAAHTGLRDSAYDLLPPEWRAHR